MRQLPPDDISSEFESNYEYYRQRMERRLVKQVHDRGRFDDICQDTFVRAWTYFSRPGAKLPQTDYHLGNLLANMAEQVAIDDYRKNKSKNYVYLSESDEDAHIPELMVEGDDDLICDRDWFQEAFVQLPSRQRDIAQLMGLGYKQKQIAVLLGISPSTVNEYVSLVREELRRKLYPVTIDLLLGQASLARDAMNNLMSGISGDIHAMKIAEYEVKARDWGYRRGYMREHISEIREDVSVGYDPYDDLLWSDHPRGMFIESGLWVPKGVITRDPEELKPFNPDGVHKPTKQRRTNAKQ